jgi:hypothetical protein
MASSHAFLSSAHFSASILVKSDIFSGSQLPDDSHVITFSHDFLSSVEFSASILTDSDVFLGSSLPDDSHGMTSSPEFSSTVDFSESILADSSILPVSRIPDDSHAITSSDKFASWPPHSGTVHYDSRVFAQSSALVGSSTPPFSATERGNLVVSWRDGDYLVYTAAGIGVLCVVIGVTILAVFLYRRTEDQFSEVSDVEMPVELSMSSFSEIEEFTGFTEESPLDPFVNDVFCCE